MAIDKRKIGGYTEKRVRKMTRSLSWALVALVLSLPFTQAFAANLDSSLITAVKQGQESSALSLLSQGANPNAFDSYGYTATMWAVSRGNPALLSALLKAGGDLTHVPASFNPVIEAAKAGNAGNISLLSSLSYAIDTPDALGNTALMYAAVIGSTSSVQALLSEKANINAQDIHGQTALIKSAQNGNAAMVSFLVSNGADINAQDHFGYSALMWAAHNGQLPAVQALLSSHALTSLEGRDGLTALTIAQKRGYTQIANILKG